MCVCNTGIEDNTHFLLHCPLFDVFRNDLLGQLSCLPELDLSNINPQALSYLILYGSPTLNESVNRRILEASIAYIKATNHRNSRTRTLAASRDIADLWKSKMVPTKRQNNGGIADQLTRTNYWLDRARYLSVKFGSTTGQMD